MANTFDIDTEYGVTTLTDTTTGTTVDAYTEIITNVDKFRTTIHYVNNTGDTNDLDYKIDGSIDGTNYEALKAETTLQEETDYFETDTDAWTYIKVSVKATVGSSQTTYSVSVKGITG